MINKYVIEQSWQTDHWHDELAIPFTRPSRARKHAKEEAESWLALDHVSNATYRIEVEDNDTTVYRNDQPWYRYHLSNFPKGA